MRQDLRTPLPVAWPIRLYGDDTWDALVRFYGPGPKPGTKGDPIDLSGRVYTAQVRSDSGTVLATMTVDSSQAADGEITLRIPDDKVRGLRGVWDLEEVIPGTPPQRTTLFAGPVTWTSDVTR